MENPCATTGRAQDSWRAQSTGAAGDKLMLQSSITAQGERLVVVTEVYRTCNFVAWIPVSTYCADGAPQ
jgi:hypothetical protein